METVARYKNDENLDANLRKAPKDQKKVLHQI